MRFNGGSPRGGCPHVLFVAISLQQLTLNPLQFLADIVDNVAGLQAVRQDVPCIRFYFELARDRIRLVELQSILNGKPSSAERSQIVEKDRYMNVGAPLARTGI